jgi:hypothetical protein
MTDPASDGSIVEGSRTIVRWRPHRALLVVFVLFDLGEQAAAQLPSVPSSARGAGSTPSS